MFYLWPGANCALTGKRYFNGKASFRRNPEEGRHQYTKQDELPLMVDLQLNDALVGVLPIRVNISIKNKNTTIVVFGVVK